MPTNRPQGGLWLCCEQKRRGQQGRNTDAQSYHIGKVRKVFCEKICLSSATHGGGRDRWRVSCEIEIRGRQMEMPDRCAVSDQKCRSLCPRKLCWTASGRVGRELPIGIAEHCPSSGDPVNAGRGRAGSEGRDAGCGRAGRGLCFESTVVVRSEK